MSKRTGRRLDAVLKAKVALEALGNEATIAELAAKYQQRLVRLEALGPKPKSSRPRRRSTGSTPTCCAGWRSTGPTRACLRESGGVGGEHHIHSDGPRLSLAGRGDGLVQPLRLGVAAIEHDGHLVLPRRPRRRPE